MKVLLTGNRGYIGTVLSPMLQERGHEVHGLDTDLFAACTFYGDIPDVPTTIKDSRDIEPGDVEGFDAIIHLAGLSNDPLGDFRPGITDEVNAQASIRLAKLAKDAGVERYLFASSCSNYGAAGDDFLTEESDFNPVTPYGVSKVDVERAVGPMASDGFSPTFLRASTAYGCSPRLRFDLVVNNLTAWAFTTGRVLIKSDGTPWRPLVHVEDIARAYVAILEADQELVHGKAFNVGSTTENYRVSEVARLVEKIVPGCEIEFAEDGGPDKRCYRVNCEELATTLHGFKPQWTVERGIKQLYEQYVESGLTLEDFEGQRFQRIAHLKSLVADGRVDDEFRWVK